MWDFIICSGKEEALSRPDERSNERTNADTNQRNFIPKIYIAVSHNGFIERHFLFIFCFHPGLLQKPHIAAVLLITSKDLKIHKYFEFYCKIQFCCSCSAKSIEEYWAQMECILNIKSLSFHHLQKIQLFPKFRFFCATKNICYLTQIWTVCHFLRTLVL